MAIGEVSRDSAYRIETALPQGIAAVFGNQDISRPGPNTLRNRIKREKRKHRRSLKRRMATMESPEKEPLGEDEGQDEREEEIEEESVGDITDVPAESDHDEDEGCSPAGTLS